MWNTILVLLLIHTILYFKSKKNNHSPTLSCGLFGYLGSKDKPLNWDKFNSIGRDNDIRGGDSIGRTVGDQTTRFVNSKKAKTTYEDFVINNINDEPSNIALGHTRKASVGGVSEAMAQPIELDLPDEEGKFIMVHNGTIYNWKELAKKYEVSTVDKSDSMVLAEIIMNNGYDVLKEYQGAAAIIIKDDRQPDTLIVFKGESKSYNNVSEERPLYYYEREADSMYISSREEGLYFIGGDTDTVHDFNTNTLYEIYEGAIVSELEYDRTAMSQSRVVYTTQSNNASTYRRGGNGYYAYDEYEDAYAYGNYNAGKDFNNILPKIQFEGFAAGTLENKIVFSKLRYWKKVGTTYNKLNGIVHITENGYIQHAPLYKETIKTKVYYFYNGFMIPNKERYSDICKTLGKSKRYSETYSNTNIASFFTTHPICTILSTGNMQDARWGENNINNANYYSGEITPLFSDKKYTFKNGDLKSIDLCTTKNLPVHTKIKNLKPETPSLPAVITVEDNVEEDPDVIKEINNCIQSLLLAIDHNKNGIEIVQINSTAVENVLHNLNTLEDVLLNDKLFKTKKIEITHEAF